MVVGEPGFSLAQKNGGSRRGSPQEVRFYRLRLERNARTELNLPHQAVGFQSGNQPTTLGAINATVGISIDGMVEHIEKFQL